jgi:geranylgeranyl diphosphate synthase type II
MTNNNRILNLDTDLKDFNQNLDRIRSEIDSYLLETSSAPYPENLYQPMKYFLELSGKRLRPLLTLLSCQSVSGEYSKAMPAAVAIELLHNFTLVHDDIMDQDRMRRGKPTVHTKWSESVAILTGDGLIGLAYRTLLKSPRESLPKVLKIFTEGVIRVCEGQAIDKDFEDQDYVTMREYFDMIEKKTGELIAVSTEIGGIIGTGENEKSKALRKFGEYIGRAFQIQDDIFDITSSESVLGKDLGSDLAQGKKTYAIIRIQEYTPPEKWDYVKEILKSRKVNSETLHNIKNIMSEYGILQEAEKQIKSDIESAKEYLLKIDNGNWAKDLLDFSTLILNRKK